MTVWDEDIHVSRLRQDWNTTVRVFRQSRHKTQRLKTPTLVLPWQVWHDHWEKHSETSMIQHRLTYRLMTLHFKHCRTCHVDTQHQKTVEHCFHLLVSATHRTNWKTINSYLARPHTAAHTITNSSQIARSHITVVDVHWTSSFQLVKEHWTSIYNTSSLSYASTFSQYAIVLWLLPVTDERSVSCLLWPTYLIHSNKMHVLSV